MKPSIYLVAADLPGKLFIMPKPSGEWLEDDVGHYKTMGVDTVVSMLERHEAKELSLEFEAELCAARGLDFVQFPIVDRGLPKVDPFKEFVEKLVNRLINRQGVAVHCRAGIGRSGMVVCSALIGLGYSVSDAIDLVSEARGVNVPDTEEQREFVAKLAR